MLNIENWWGELSSTAQMFWGIAVVFSVLGFIQFVLSLFGLDFDGELEEQQKKLRIATSEQEQQKSSYNVFSARNVIIFLAFFGWSNLLLLQGGKPLTISIIIAAIIASVAMIVVGYALYRFAKLARGENLDLNEILFTTAEVRVTIPANQTGHGKVKFYYGKILKEADAITSHITSLPTASTVRIIDVIDRNLVVVEPFNG
ncbi:MAG: hypothetical protein AAGG68_14290 [Bacteroidota bacterium]